MEQPMVNCVRKELCEMQRVLLSWTTVCPAKLESTATKVVCLNHQGTVNRAIIAQELLGSKILSLTGSCVRRVITAHVVQLTPKDVSLGCISLISETIPVSLVLLASFVLAIQVFPRIVQLINTVPAVQLNLYFVQMELTRTAALLDCPIPRSARHVLLDTSVNEEKYPENVVLGICATEEIQHQHQMVRIKLLESCVRTGFIALLGR